MPTLQKKTTADINTLFRCMKTIGMGENVESLPASELDHLLQDFHEYPQEKRRIRTRCHIWFSTKYPKIFN